MKNVNREPTGRYHFLETYLPESEIKRVFNHYDDYIIGALYIYHDKDIKETDEQSGKRLQKLEELQQQTKINIEILNCGIENSQKIYNEQKFVNAEEQKQFRKRNITTPKSQISKLTKKLQNIENDISVIKQDQEEVGNPKLAHWHILLKTYDDHTANAVRRWFYKFRVTEKKEIDGEEKDMLINTMNQIVQSPSAARDYLTHRNNPEKYQYDPKEIQDWKRAKETFSMKGRTRDDSITIIDRLNENESIRQLISEYGLDFVYHLRHFQYAAGMVKAQEDQAQNDIAKYEKMIYQGNADKITSQDWDKCNNAAYIVTCWQEFTKHINYLEWLVKQLPKEVSITEFAEKVKENV